MERANDKSDKQPCQECRPDTFGTRYGAGGDIGAGASTGVQVTGSSNSVSGTTGVGRYGFGGGISLGFDMCWTEFIKCAEKPCRK